MSVFSAAPLLVPPGSGEAEAGLVIFTSPIVRGLPHLIDLGGGVQLKLVLPTGLLQPWIDADPAMLVASDGTELAPFDPASSDFRSSIASPRVLVLWRGATIASLALSRGALRRGGDSGTAATGTILEMLFLDWRIHAGSVRGMGDFGSYLRFAWRLAEAVDEFGPPVINPVLKLRLLPEQRQESDLGRRVRLPIDRRFIDRRVALRVPR